MQISKKRRFNITGSSGALFFIEMHAFFVVVVLQTVNLVTSAFNNLLIYLALVHLILEREVKF